MRCTIVLEFDNGDGSVVKRVEVMRFHRPIGKPGASWTFCYPPQDATTM